MLMADSKVAGTRKAFPASLPQAPGCIVVMGVSVSNFNFHHCCTSKYSIRDDNESCWQPGTAGELPVLPSLFKKFLF